MRRTSMSRKFFTELIDLAFDYSHSTYFVMEAWETLTPLQDPRALLND